MLKALPGVGILGSGAGWDFGSLFRSWSLQLLFLLFPQFFSLLLLLILFPGAPSILFLSSPLSWTSSTLFLSSLFPGAPSTLFLAFLFPGAPQLSFSPLSLFLELLQLSLSPLLFPGALLTLFLSALFPSVALSSCSRCSLSLSSLSSLSFCSLIPSFLFSLCSRSLRSLSLCSLSLCSLSLCSLSLASFSLCSRSLRALSLCSLSLASLSLCSFSLRSFSLCSLSLRSFSLCSLSFCSFSSFSRFSLFLLLSSILRLASAVLYESSAPPLACIFVCALLYSSSLLLSLSSWLRSLLDFSRGGSAFLLERGCPRAANGNRAGEASADALLLRDLLRLEDRLSLLDRSDLSALRLKWGRDGDGHPFFTAQKMGNMMRQLPWHIVFWDIIGGPNGRYFQENPTSLHASFGEAVAKGISDARSARTKSLWKLSPWHFQLVLGELLSSDTSELSSSLKMHLDFLAVLCFGEACWDFGAVFWSSFCGASSSSSSSEDSSSSSSSSESLSGSTTHLASVVCFATFGRDRGTTLLFGAAPRIGGCSGDAGFASSSESESEEPKNAAVSGRASAFLTSSFLTLLAFGGIFHLWRILGPENFCLHRHLGLGHGAVWKWSLIHRPVKHSTDAILRELFKMRMAVVNDAAHQTGCPELRSQLLHLGGLESPCASQGIHSLKIPLNLKMAGLGNWMISDILSIEAKKLHTKSLWTHCQLTKPT